MSSQEYTEVGKPGKVAGRYFAKNDTGNKKKYKNEHAHNKNKIACIFTIQKKAHKAHKAHYDFSLFLPLYE
ncbi:hypothetical protein [Erwinia persicina]|uniref:hypothetical protein n=1 Tax=Erwinia persicina TaxID=55211 RepID=UPI00177EB6A9|nr:hypothetical protein [Erwinia persicina]MBD8215089.1 hypothetical protein [Erwinia persicina]